MVMAQGRGDFGAEGTGDRGNERGEFQDRRHFGRRNETHRKVSARKR
jgi:hypothetical protein